MTILVIDPNTLNRIIREMRTLVGGMIRPRHPPKRIVRTVLEVPPGNPRGEVALENHRPAAAAVVE